VLALQSGFESGGCIESLVLVVSDLGVVLLVHGGIVRSSLKLDQKWKGQELV